MNTKLQWASGKNYTIKETVKNKQDRIFFKENKMTDKKKKMIKELKLHPQRGSHVLIKTDSK